MLIHLTRPATLFAAFALACTPGSIKVGEDSNTVTGSESTAVTGSESTAVTGSESTATTIDPSTSGTSGTSGPVVTSSGSEVTTGEPPPECACIVDDPEGQWVVPSLPTCVEPICPTVDADLESQCDTGGENDCTIQLDPAALQCALEALRDRTPGLIRWRLEMGSSAFTDDGYVWIRDDGSAIWRKWEEQDLVFEATAAQLVELPASEVYEQCLAEPDDKLRFDCLRQSLSSPDNLVCDEAFEARGI